MVITETIEYQVEDQTHYVLKTISGEGQRTSTDVRKPDLSIIEGGSITETYLGTGTDIRDKDARVSAMIRDVQVATDRTVLTCYINGQKVLQRENSEGGDGHADFYKYRIKFL